MIKFENIKVVGFEDAIRGMRNPMNSWDKSDSYKTVVEDEHTMETSDHGYFIGGKDHELAMKLAGAGPVHGKFRRMINLYVDITAPLYWWKEFDTYKVGTVANSCSTMHKIHEKEFTLDDFSCEHLLSLDDSGAAYDYDIPQPAKYNSNELTHGWMRTAPFELMRTIVEMLNVYRYRYLKTKNKDYWWQMIQLLPSSYNQKRTVMLSYEVLANIYQYRKGHKLDEWNAFCDMIERLPYCELITGVATNSEYDYRGKDGID